MEIREALTFDDVLIKPAASAVFPTDVDTSTQLTRDIPGPSKNPPNTNIC